MQSKDVKQQAWKRLKKNKPAMVSLGIIVLCCLIAVLAYWLAPDHTPNADLQTVEIQSKKPGYTRLFLRIPETTETKILGWEKFFSGEPNHASYIPIKDYSIAGNELVIHKWIDDDTTVSMHYDINIITNHEPEKINQYIIQKKYLLGTDIFGRDVLSRLLIGTRVSLSVGLVAVLISLLLGVFLGALAGYYRGRVDAIIMWLINITWSIPTLLLVFAITMAMGKGFWQVFIAVGLTLWVSVARLVRGQVLAIRELEYVQAAKVLGFKNSRIIARHILPNISGPVMVIAAGNFASAIIIESGLSFLGVGVQPPQPSWGGMIRENYLFIMTNNAILAIIPGLAIMILVLAFNILGNGLRDALDVKE